MSSVLRFPRLLAGSRLARFHYSCLLARLLALVVHDSRLTRLYYSCLLTRLLALVIHDSRLCSLSGPRAAILAADHGTAIWDSASWYRGSRLAAAGSPISPGNR